MNYYYLLSGLPDLGIAMDAQKVDFEMVYDTIQRNLAPEDEQLFRYLIYPNDNRNLLDHLFHEYQDFPKADFKYPGIIEEEQILDYRRSKSQLPDYMASFLAEFEDRFASMTMREMENELRNYFDEDIDKLEGTFIYDYHHFRKDLEAVIASYNRTAHDFLSTPQVPHADWLAAQVGKDRTPSASLLKVHPYSEGLATTFATSDPVALERFVDQVLWDYTQEVKGYFSRDQVFAYTVRLLLTWRWRQLDVETGAQRLESLMETIKNKERSPKTPVV